MNRPSPSRWALALVIAAACALALPGCVTEYDLPEGDPWHYRFVGTDRSVYEVSYDFSDHPYKSDEGTEHGCYCLRDGKPQEMGSCFYNHFTPREIEELAGLRLVDE